MFHMRPNIYRTRSIYIEESSRVPLASAMSLWKLLYKHISITPEKSVHARERRKARHAGEFDCDIGI